jgi:hypothetical protein
MIGRLSQNFSGAKCLKGTKNAWVHNVWVVLGHGLRVAGQIDTLSDVRKIIDLLSILNEWPQASVKIMWNQYAYYGAQKFGVERIGCLLR